MPGDDVAVPCGGYASSTLTGFPTIGRDNALGLIYAFRIMNTVQLQKAQQHAKGASESSPSFVVTR